MESMERSEQESHWEIFPVERGSVEILEDSNKDDEEAIHSEEHRERIHSEAVKELKTASVEPINSEDNKDKTDSEGRDKILSVANKEDSTPLEDVRGQMEASKEAGTHLEDSKEAKMTSTIPFEKSST